MPHSRLTARQTPVAHDILQAMGQTQTGTVTRIVSEILPHEATSRLASYKRGVQRALPGVGKMILFGSRARDQSARG